MQRFRYAIFILLLLAFAGKTLHAQDAEYWTTAQYFPRFSEKWGAALDINQRWRQGNGLRSDVSAIRLGTTYFLPNNMDITAGYAWFGTHKINTSYALLHENRLWEQLIIHHHAGKWKLAQRIRLEQRFRQSETAGRLESNFSNRLRYMITGETQFARINKKKGGAFLVLGEEIHLQAGENTGQHFFDQNRVLAGVDWRLNPNVALLALYQFTNRYSLSQEKIRNIHVFRLTLTVRQIFWKNENE